MSSDPAVDPPPSIAAEDLGVSAYLGQGAYAFVYQATWQGQQVAIKAVPVKNYGGSMGPQIAREGADTRFGLQSFVHEAVLLHQLSHRCAPGLRSLSATLVYRSPLQESFCAQRATMRPRWRARSPACRPFCVVDPVSALAQLSHARTHVAAPTLRSERDVSLSSSAVAPGGPLR